MEANFFLKIHILQSNKESPQASHWNPTQHQRVFRGEMSIMSCSEVWLCILVPFETELKEPFRGDVTGAAHFTGCTSEEWTLTRCLLRLTAQCAFTWVSEVPWLQDVMGILLLRRMRHFDALNSIGGENDNSHFWALSSALLLSGWSASPEGLEMD